jgi:DNA replication protein DnaC/transposase
VRSTLEWAQVRAMAADGKSQREIAARLGINRRTVRRMLASEDPPRYRRAPQGSKVDPFEPVIRRVLEEWPEIKAPRMTEILREHGYEGSVDLVKRRLRRLRAPRERPARRTGYRPGQVLQLDWAELPTRPRIAGRERRIYALVASLPYSGAQSAHFSFEMTLESFLEGHVRIFDWLGGVTRECVYDNLRSVVAKRERDVVHWNPRFLHLRGHYAFHSTACTPQTPREKGAVEGAVRHLKSGFWPGRRIASLDELDEQYRAWRGWGLQPPPARHGTLPGLGALGRGAAGAPPLATRALRLRLRARVARAARRLPALPRLLLPGARGARASARHAERGPRLGLDLTPRPGGRPLPAQLRARQLAPRAEAAPRASARTDAGGDRRSRDRAARALRLRGALRVNAKGRQARVGERLPYLLQKLKAPRVLERLEQTAERARAEEWPYEQFLEALLEAEVFARDASGARQRIRHAQFPAQKTLEDFDWQAQPAAERPLVMNLAQLAWIEERANVCFLGPPGTGKTHLAIALSIKACQQGFRVTFATAQQWVMRLEAAQERNQLEQELRRLERYHLLVVDEVGYLPLERQAANLLFALVSRRYERGSIVVTSNRSFEQWGEILGDAMVAAALIDRLVHHATMVTLKGKSYRLRERGAGVAPAAPAPSLRDSA